MNKRFTLSCLAFLLLPALTRAQSTWESSFVDGTFSDNLYRLAELPDGHFLAAMISKETQSSPDFQYIAKLSPAGELLEVDTSIQGYASWPPPYLFPKPDGNTLVMSFWEAPNAATMTLAHYTPSFQHVWDGTLDVPFAGVPLRINDTTFVVARRTTNSIQAYKVGLSGTVYWQTTLQSTTTSAAAEPLMLSLELLPNGEICVGSSFYSKLLFGRLNLDGDIINQVEAGWWWGESWPTPTEVTVSNGLYICLKGGQILAVNTDGTTVWSSYAYTILSTPNSVIFKDLLRLPDGNLAVMGSESASYTDISLGKFTPDGNRIWTSTFGEHMEYEGAKFFQLANDGSFLIVGEQLTSPLQYDALLIKANVAGALLPSVVHGRVVADENENCLAEANEIGMEGLMIRAVYENGSYYRTTGPNGEYTVPSGQGLVTVEIANFDPYKMAACYTSETLAIAENTDTTELNFMVDTVSCPLMLVDLATTALRPCFDAWYTLSYCNEGTTTAHDATIAFYPNGYLEVFSASLPYTQPDNNTFHFEIGDVLPGGCGSISVSVHVSCDAVVGTELCSSVFATPDTVCVDLPIFEEDPPYHERDCRITTASFDPNDKMPRAGTDELIGLDSTLKYLVRFQNTGTDTAFNIVVVDTLSPFVEPLSIEPGAGSHPFRWEMKDFGIVHFIFENILLPDSNTNEALSHGFVQFKIRPRPNLERGTVFYNQAAIYFDFNEPVMTNTTAQLIDYPKDTTELSMTLCQGSSLLGLNLESDTLLTETIYLPALDSIVLYHLTVLPVSFTNQDTVVAFGAMVGGQAVFAEGEYATVLTGDNGCDSTLLVHAVPTGIGNANIIIGDSSPCSGETENYAAPYNPNAYYYWTAEDGYVVDGQGTRIVSVQWYGQQLGVLHLTIYFNNEIIEVSPKLVPLIPNQFITDVLITELPCYGSAEGAIELVMQPSGGPYQYAWSNGSTGNALTGIGTGWYEVTVTGAIGCTQAFSYGLVEPEQFWVSYTATPPSAEDANDGSIYVYAYGATPPFQYLWSNGAADSPNNESLAAGNYGLTITDANGCTWSELIELGTVSATDEPHIGPAMSLQPNPTTGIAQLVFEKPFGGQPKVVLLDGVGRQVKSSTEILDNQRIQLNLHGLPPGVYTVQVRTAAQLFSVKLVKI